jgi:hypothetical protein
MICYISTDMRFLFSPTPFPLEICEVTRPGCLQWAIDDDLEESSAENRTVMDMLNCTYPQGMIRSSATTGRFRLS